jgi:hypothetical protein
MSIPSTDPYSVAKAFFEMMHENDSDSSANFAEQDREQNDDKRFTRIMR